MTDLSRIPLGLAAFFLSAVPAAADVQLPALFGNHMVAQCEAPFPVYGTADPGEEVTVRLGRNLRHGMVWNPARQVKADGDGHWRIDLPARMPGGPYELSVSATNHLRVRDLWFGEVWLCSGQSNMHWPVKDSDDAEREIAAADHPAIRFFTVPLEASETPKAEVEGTWKLCSPSSVEDFSAVAYFFGRSLERKLGRKIGLIHSSWGGTRAEAWTEMSFLAGDEAFGPLLEREPPEARHAPAALYNGMIAPLVPFRFRGVIWYQGESNAEYATLYAELFPTLIRSWRSAFGHEFPFLFVQLANFHPVKDEPSVSEWAELRESQSRTLALPLTGMAVIIDIGEADDIHPRNKQDVGLRLALAARRIAYGENLVHSGPTPASVEVHGPEILLGFDHVGGGLAARGGRPLRGFAVAGEDQVFHWATAVIVGRDRVAVRSPAVPQPVAVRYAWATNPVCNLTNREGLPASPFRTDDWPGVTAGRR